VQADDAEFRSPFRRFAGKLGVRLARVFAQYLYIVIRHVEYSAPEALKTASLAAKLPATAS
jgi:hypothetical protein